MAKIELKYITKNELLQTDIKEAKTLLQNPPKKHFWELRGITFSINYGEAVGLVGVNGSGKSALMKIIAGLERQTTGFITTKSKVNYASVAAGLNFEATGLENIRQKISQENIDSFKGDHLTNAIINFTEIGQWLYRPVKYYSLGMKARLALGLALFIEPDLVLLDDVLYLLDRAFYQKVARKIQLLKDNGCSFLISDTRGLMLESFCERTLWLEFGAQEDFGATKEVLPQFDYYLDWYNNLDLPEQNKFLAKKQAQQADFDVSVVYEKFKIEQFRHGYTRKDEARMRKAFYVDRGIDPVSGDLEHEVEKIQANKALKKATKMSPKLKVALGLLVIIILGAGVWVATNDSISLTKNQASESSRIAKIKRQEKSSLALQSSKQAKSKAQKVTQKAAKSSSQTSTLADASSVSSQQATSQSSSQTASSAATSQASSASQAEEQTQVITVANGDTIGELATKYNTTVAKIQELNGMGTSVDLTAGTSLKVPK